MIAIFASALVATLLAEVVGDKTLYTAGALAGAHRPGPVLVGAVLAAALKMAVAVAAGGLLASLPSWLLTTLAVATWLGVAAALWRSPPRAERQPSDIGGPKLAGQAFFAIFFTEWGDPGELVAAVLAARTGAPAVVWLAAVSAMTLKILAGVGLTRLVRGRLAPRTYRLAGVAMFLLFGAITLAGMEG